MKRKGWRVIVYGVLAVVCIVALAVPLYDRQTPRLMGLPFFIWFQMAWVIVAAAATAVALRVCREEN